MRLCVEKGASWYLPRLIMNPEKPNVWKNLRIPIFLKLAKANRSRRCQSPKITYSLYYYLHRISEYMGLQAKNPDRATYD